MLGAGNIIADFPEINIWHNEMMISKDKHCQMNKIISMSILNKQNLPLSMKFDKTVHDLSWSSGSTPVSASGQFI